jgi:hypothetical protein
VKKVSNNLFFIDLQDKIANSVDDPGVFDNPYAFRRFVETGVNMTVNKILGGKTVNQGVETFKAPVTRIFRITDIAWWRMGDYDIDASVPP